MQDLLFYFANSPSGGGQTRLGAYLRFVPDLAKDRRCIFVVNWLAVPKTPQKSNAEVISHKTSAFRRLFAEDAFFRQRDVRQATVFSHGAPIRPNCAKYVLHFNNALPFATASIPLEPILHLKMVMLRRRLLAAAKVADVISVESNATKALVCHFCDSKTADKIRVLGNGVDTDVPTKKPAKGNYVITFGTHLYKRIDMAFAAYRRLRESRPGLRLLVVDTHGNSTRLPSDPLIEILPLVDYATARGLIDHCDVFLSASAIENSSIALLEALAAGRTVVCSDIPSHMESLHAVGYEYKSFAPGMVEARPLFAKGNFPSWKDIARETVQLLVD